MMNYLGGLACVMLVAAMSVYAVEANAGENTAKIRIIRGGSQPTKPGEPEQYTGSVRIDHPFRADAPGRHRGEYVTYEPGARSMWHTHPAGERGFVIAGKMLVQEWGGPVREVSPGEVIWFPPEVKHWHGAAPDTGATTLSFHEHVDGQTATWQENVSEVQYSEKPSDAQSRNIYSQLRTVRSSSRHPFYRYGAHGSDFRGQAGHTVVWRHRYI